MHYTSSPLTHACAQGIRKSYRCGFANGLLFASGNIMAGAGFLFGAFLIKTRLEETYKADAARFFDTGNGFIPQLDPKTDQPIMGANCRNGGPEVGNTIEECGFTGGNLMIAMFAIQ